MPRRQTVIAATSFALLLGGLGAGTAQADPGSAVYVNDAAANCNDSGPGTQAEPFCQIQAAADAATAPGDTVHISGGGAPYAPFTVSASGTSDNPITFTTDNTKASMTVEGSATAAVTVAGAQYVDLVGINATGAAGNDALVVTGAAQHIDYSVSHLRENGAQPGAPVPAAVAIGGGSTDISITRAVLTSTSGWGLTSASGSRRITLSSDAFIDDTAGGLSATGTQTIDIAGDNFYTSCGNAVSLTGGTSGSVENIVASRDPVDCLLTDPAEIAVDAASANLVTADYNAVNPGPQGNDYNWAGSDYATSTAFTARTTQGSHDLDQTKATFNADSEQSGTSPLIDSGDGNAPGESATDYDGKPRGVDDLLVPNTGSGGGAYDRGVFELQDPLGPNGISSSTNGHGTAQVPATFTFDWYNPWSEPLTGISYSFTFGDGAVVPSTSGAVPHTYTQPGTYTVSAVATRNGVQLGSYSESYSVAPLPALSSSIGCSTTPAAPDATSCGFQPSSALPLTVNQVTFGDRTPAATPDAYGALNHTYTAPGSYTVTENLTDSLGRTSTTTQTATVGPAFVPYGPYRVLDTRYGTGAAKQPVGPGGIVRVKIAGTDGIPSSGLTAVTLNVTDTHATASSWVTAYADGSTRPNASNLNFAAGQTNPNLITVPVGKDGYVDLWNANGRTDLFADVQGYYTTTPSTGSQSMSNLDWTTPTRVLDTRYGTGAPKGPVGPGSTTWLTLPAAAGTATTGVVLNLTATGATSSGWITVSCSASNAPTTSTINYRAGQTTSNLVVTTVCNVGGQVEIYNSGGHVNLFADVQGYYTNEFAGSPTDFTGNARPGSPFVPTAPTRILDTRYGTGAAKQPVGPGGTVSVKVTGSHGIPTGAGAVLINLTGTAPSTSTYLTAFGGGTLPSTSNIDLVRGETRPVLAVVPIDAGGYIHIHNAYGSVNVFADLEGYYS